MTDTLQIRADVHTHTVASTHGYSTIQENAAAARSLGLKLLAVTDHGPAMPDAPHVWHFHNYKVLPREIDGVKMLYGVEANIIDENGTLDMDTHELSFCEWVIASYHTQCVQFDRSPALVSQGYRKICENSLVDVIGHPTTLVVSLLLIPVTLVLAVVLPGNEFLPLASLAGMFYIFPLVLPITKGNVVKTFIVGLVVILIGLYFVTDLAPFFTQAAQDVFAKTGDAAVAIPAGFEGGSLDFASNPLAWVIFHLTYSCKWIGVTVLVLVTMFLMFLNRRAIIRYQKAASEEGQTENK